MKTALTPTLSHESVGEGAAFRPPVPRAKSLPGGTAVSRQLRESGPVGLHSIAIRISILAAAMATSISSPLDASEHPLAAQVTIHRDEWGVPHIDGPTDESVVFGFGYAQAEDFLWQVEDSFVLATGR